MHDRIGPSAWTTISTLFKPSNVAVIGVSETSPRGGNTMFNTLREHHFEGQAYAVGRSGGRLGREPIYPSIEKLPDVPDVTFSAVGVYAPIDAYETAGMVPHIDGWVDAVPHLHEFKNEVAEECKRKVDEQGPKKLPRGGPGTTNPNRFRDDMVPRQADLDFAHRLLDCTDP